MKFNVPEDSVLRLSNPNGKVYVVGDLHGCRSVLEKALYDVGFNKHEDMLFSLGDLTDRGDENFETLKLLYEPWFYSIRANHDQMLIDYVLSDGEYYPDYRKTYGEWIDLENVDSKELRQLCLKFKTYPIAIEITSKTGKKYGLVHAQVPGNDWKFIDSGPNGFSMDQRQWSRTQVTDDMNYPEFDLSDTKNVDLVLLGHTPFLNSPIKKRNRVYLDTAVWKTRRVNLYEIV